DARRNIHTVTHQIVALDHDIADMDADAQRQATLVVGFLYRRGAAYRLNSAGELDQEAVAHRLEEPPGVFGDLWLDHSGPQSLKPRQRPSLVAADELRVADHVGHQDRGKAALLGHSGTPARRSPSPSSAKSSDRRQGA